MKNSNDEETANICLWRRTLIAVVETSRVQHTILAKKLAIPVNIATALVQRLEIEGFLKSAGKGMMNL